MNLKPLKDRVLVKRLIEQETTTQAGLIVSFSKEEQIIQQGIVIEVGNAKLQVKKNDKVYFPKYAGISFDDEYLILKEDEILGIEK